MRFQGKVVVITGGGSGIGLATVERFRAEGAQVHVLDIATGCDVSDSAQVSAALGALGRIDILVNCAGVAVRNSVTDEDEEAWDHTIQVNVRGIYVCSKHALPMMEAGASIINISSVAGITGMRNRAAYSASKGAVVSLTRNMALDYSALGIRVNCVCPGFVKTSLIAPLEKDPVRLGRITALHPLGRLGEPDDIANMILFLASDEASWITGQAIAVDGGFTAGHSANI